jgi:hypothetical protein
MGRAPPVVFPQSDKTSWAAVRPARIGAGDRDPTGTLREDPPGRAKRTRTQAQKGKEKAVKMKTCG